ncbi:restriction endonuclease [Campylobacter upsaliensis]
MDLFLELAKPDEKGFSRWVGVDEFVGDYKDLQFGNGGSWCRASSNLAKTYIVEFDKTRTSGNSIDAIRLQGFNPLKTFNQNIRKDIKDFYKSQKCVMLGVCGKSENTTIEIDHKDGRKDSMRVSELAMQEFEDFQPLCKAANDIKRQICKTCKETNTRWSAKNIKGNPYDFYAGDERYIAQSEGGLGCVGCYQYDPVAKKVRGKSQKKQRTLSVQNFMEMYELHRLKA